MCVLYYCGGGGVGVESFTDGNMAGDTSACESTEINSGHIPMS